jgi:hypothetical protein
VPVSEQDDNSFGIGFNSKLNYKFSARHSNRTGVSYKYLEFNNHVFANSNPLINDSYDYFVNSKGNASVIQAHTQSSLYLTKRFLLRAGFHFSYFSLNGDFSPEPRIGGEWQINQKHIISFAYGKHSRLEPLNTYLMEVSSDGEDGQFNKNLDVTKAHHFVLGYNWKFGDNTHLKLEPYYQVLYDVPVSPDSSFSMINYKNDMFPNIILTNKGQGVNKGIDFTFEHFLTQGFYFLFTLSVFDSKYKGGDDIQRNTRYNRNFVVNALTGKEWIVRKNNLFSINTRISIMGGERYIPIHHAQSLISQYTVYDYTNAYRNRFPTNYYIDLSLNYKINRPKFSHSFIVQVKNILKQKEYIGHYYNYITTEIETSGFSLILPYVSYKVEF